MVINNLIELKPFSRVIWRWGVPVEWKNALGRAGDIARRVEYEAVVRGLRQADVVHLTQRDWDTQIKRFTKDDLYYVPILRTKRYEGFSHRFYPVEKMGEDTMVYGVIARSLEDAKLFAEAHRTRPSDHRTIGKLLGYPDCCIDFFIETFPKGILDPVAEIKHDGENPMLNQMLRYFGPRIAPHFPCSFTCPEAEKFAESIYEIMLDLDSDLSQRVLDILSMPAVWSLYKSIIQVTTPLFTGICNGYWSERKTVIWRGDFEKWREIIPVQFEWFLRETGI
ncbi:hypothetical protein ES703_02607 [subsurface metagenome]